MGQATLFQGLLSGSRHFLGCLPPGDGGKIGKPQNETAGENERHQRHTSHLQLCLKILLHLFLKAVLPVRITR